MTDDVDSPFPDAELQARVTAAEEWSAPGNPASHLPSADLIALAIATVVLCVLAWLWGAP